MKSMLITNYRQYHCHLILCPLHPGDDALISSCFLLDNVDTDICYLCRLAQNQDFNLLKITSFF